MPKYSRELIELLADGGGEATLGDDDTEASSRLSDDLGERFG